MFKEISSYLDNLTLKRYALFKSRIWDSASDEMVASFLTFKDQSFRTRRTLTERLIQTPSFSPGESDPEKRPDWPESVVTSGIWSSQVL